MTVLYSAPAQSFMSVLLGAALGEFEKENLEVELQQVPTTDGAVLVARGQAQVQMAGFNASALNLLAKEPSPIKYVTTSCQEEPASAGLYIRNDFLKGGHVDPVAIQGQSMSFGPGGGGLGTTAALQWYIHAKRYGISLNAVEPATLNSVNDAALAMLNNRIAGASLWSAAARLLEPQKDRFTMVERNAATGVFVAGTAWLKNQPDVAAAFFRAVMRTNRTYLQGDYLKNPMVLDAQVKIFGSTPENVAADGLAGYARDLDPTVPKTLFPMFQDLAREAKVLSYNNTLNVDDVFDLTPVQDVLQGRY